MSLQQPLQGNKARASFRYLQYCPEKKEWAPLGSLLGVQENVTRQEHYL